MVSQLPQLRTNKTRKSKSSTNKFVPPWNRGRHVKVDVRSWFCTLPAVIQIVTPTIKILI